MKNLIESRQEGGGGMSAGSQLPAEGISLKMLPA